MVIGVLRGLQRMVQRYGGRMEEPAHCGMFLEHRHRANQLIEHHRYREAEMLDLVRRKPKCAYEIAQEVFGGEERPIFHVMAATFETLAHLDLACLEGRAHKNERNGMTLYQAA